MTNTSNPTVPSTLEALRIKRNDLRSVLVHECQGCDTCLCFGQEDVDAYDRAEAEYQAAVAARINERRDAAHAAEQAARAAELDVPALPEAERTMSYEAALHHVLCHSTRPDAEQEQIAQRMHTHGKGHWHTSWVLFGSDGRGCSCYPCSKASTH